MYFIYPSSIYKRKCEREGCVKRVTTCLIHLLALVRDVGVLDVVLGVQ